MPFVFLTKTNEQQKKTQFYSLSFLSKSSKTCLV